MGMAMAPRVVDIFQARHQRGEDRYDEWPTWCLHLYRYHGELEIAGDLERIHPGTVTIMPNGSTFSHRWFQDDSYHICVHFHPATAGSPVMTAPLIQTLGENWEATYGALLEAVGWMRSQPRRTEARVWDVLWHLVRPPEDDHRAKLHPALQRALQIVEMHLAEPIKVADLAQEAGVSHNHLIRLFRSSFGTTITAYIRKRRAERAGYLLASTSMPIKSIATHVGATDLQHFNKLIRSAYGRSPRQVREDAAV